LIIPDSVGALDSEAKRRSFKKTSARGEKVGQGEDKSERRGESKDPKRRRKRMKRIPWHKMVGVSMVLTSSRYCDQFCRGFITLPIECLA